MPCICIYNIYIYIYNPSTRSLCPTCSTTKFSRQKLPQSEVPSTSPVDPWRRWLTIDRSDSMPRSLDLVHGMKRWTWRWLMGDDVASGWLVGWMHGMADGWLFDDVTPYHAFMIWILMIVRLTLGIYPCTILEQHTCCWWKNSCTNY